MVETREGKTVEIGIVGNEGIVGLELAVGLTRSPLREVVQIAGDGFSIKAWALESALQSSPYFRETLAITLFSKACRSRRPPRATGFTMWSNGLHDGF